MSSVNSLASGIAMQQAVVRRDLAVSLLKDAANQDRAIINVLEQSSRTVQALSSRGGNVNFTV